MKKYQIVLEDGSVEDMTAEEVAARVGLKQSLVVRRLRKGMRRIERLSETSEQALRRARRAFTGQSAALFAENKKKREYYASRPVYREWKRMD